jgi:hypothetical protein
MPRNAAAAAAAVEGLGQGPDGLLPVLVQEVGANHLNSLGYLVLYFTSELLARFCMHAFCVKKFYKKIQDL